MPKIHCKSCGYIVQPIDRFCLNCGAPLESSKNVAAERTRSTNLESKRSSKTTLHQQQARATGSSQTPIKTSGKSKPWKRSSNVPWLLIVEGIGLLLITLAGIFIITGTKLSFTPKFKPAEYASTTGTASPGVEMQIALDDGAAISIPETSIEKDVSVKIERNPDKAKTLPPLPEGFLQVGDFYNFEVTNGELAGPVDLTLPFNDGVIPSGNGLLTVGIPSENGWEFVPVASDGNTITIYTDNLGDPIIAWHFADETEKVKIAGPVCDPIIPIQVIPEEGGKSFRIIGRLTPVSRDIASRLGDKISSMILGEEVIFEANHMPVNVYINNQSTSSIDTFTNAGGVFNTVIDSNFDLKQGINHIKVMAECQTLIPTYTSDGFYKATSVGFASFTYNTEMLATEIPSQPTEPPAAQPQPITPPQSPTDKIPVPNVVGMTFEDAQKTLEDLGFNTTWIDGKSNLELGRIYSQAPNAGTLSVPHRTTVVLYRTTEVVAEPPECAQFNLTPEECANAGIHKYSIVDKIYTTNSGIVTRNNEGTINIVFNNNSFSFPDSNYSCNKTAHNTYSCKDEDYNSKVFVFNESGFTGDFKVSDDFKCIPNTHQSSCSYDQHIEYSIIK